MGEGFKFDAEESSEGNTEGGGEDVSGLEKEELYRLADNAGSDEEHEKYYAEIQRRENPGAEDVPQESGEPEREAVVGEDSTMEAVNEDGRATRIEALREQLREAEGVGDESKIAEIENELRELTAREPETGKREQTVEVAPVDFGAEEETGVEEIAARPESQIENSEAKYEFELLPAYQRAVELNDGNEKLKIIKNYYHQRDLGAFNDAREEQNTDRMEEIKQDWIRNVNEAWKDVGEELSKTTEEFVDSGEGQESLEEQAEAELEKFEGNLKALEANSIRFEQVGVPEGKEVEAMKLREKLGNGMKRCFEKLSKISVEDAALVGMCVSMVTGIMQVAGSPELADAMAFLPDSIHQFLQSPEMAGNWLWSMVDHTTGNSFTLPTVENFSSFSDSLQELVSSDPTITTEARVTSGLANFPAITAAGAVAGYVGKTFGKIGSHFFKQKTK